MWQNCKINPALLLATFLKKSEYSYHKSQTPEQNTLHTPSGPLSHVFAVVGVFPHGTVPQASLFSSEYSV